MEFPWHFFGYFLVGFFVEKCSTITVTIVFSTFHFITILTALTNCQSSSTTQQLRIWQVSKSIPNIWSMVPNVPEFLQYEVFSTARINVFVTNSDTPGVRLFNLNFWQTSRKRQFLVLRKTASWSELIRLKISEF